MNPLPLADAEFFAPYQMILEKEWRVFSIIWVNLRWANLDAGWCKERLIFFKK